jgi:hypothetical protein
MEGQVSALTGGRAKSARPWVGGANILEEFELGRGCYSYTMKVGSNSGSS